MAKILHLARMRNGIRLVGDTDGWYQFTKMRIKTDPEWRDYMMGLHKEAYNKRAKLSDEYWDAWNKHEYEKCSKVAEKLGWFKEGF